jgi:hypothetical protein
VQFLPLRADLGTPWRPRGDWHFDRALLDACVRQSSTWKEAHGFPADILGWETSDALLPGIADWQTVIVDTPLQLTAAVVVASRAEVRGYAASNDAETLDLSQPAFALACDAPEAFPELGSLSKEAMARAWADWCKERGISEANAAECRCALEGTTLRVSAEPSLAERLQPAEDEAWMLVGEGEVRRLVRVAVEM